MKLPSRSKQIKRKFLFKENESDHKSELDNYGLNLIKTIGILGVVIGFIILILFYVWVFKKIF